MKKLLILPLLAASALVGCEQRPPATENTEMMATPSMQSDSATMTPTPAIPAPEASAPAPAIEAPPADPAAPAPAEAPAP